MSGHDVYLNVAGGLKIGEPAADLAAAAALISSFHGRALPKDSVFFGEISLSGDIRPAPQAELRLREAAKLGFSRAIVPAGTKMESVDMRLSEVSDIAELLTLIGAPRAVPGRARMES